MPKSIFVLKSLTVSIKSRTFVATVPATPPNNAYHGGTSPFYKGLMAAWTEIIPKNNRNDAEFGKFSTKQLFFWKVLLILHRKTKIYGKKCPTEPRSRDGFFR